tara:strand:- start:34851 stop:35078 length:228 start_codon:yes stop_codon:yes gene_type:complete
MNKPEVLEIRKIPSGAVAHIKRTDGTEVWRIRTFNPHQMYPQEFIVDYNLSNFKDLGDFYACAKKIFNYKNWDND